MPLRIEGRVDTIRATFGFIAGDDKRRYFFIPSLCLPPTIFADLKPGQRVRFYGQMYDRDDQGRERYRAYDVEELRETPDAHA